MTSIILSFIPDQALILVIVAIGIGLILGVVSRRVVAGLVVSIVLFVLLSPFVDAIMDTLPLWLLLVLMGFFFLVVIQALSKSLFGRGASDNFMGHLLWALFSFPFRILGVLFGIRRR